MCSVFPRFSYLLASARVFFFFSSCVFASVLLVAQTPYLLSGGAHVHVDKSDNVSNVRMCRGAGGAVFKWMLITGKERG